MTETLTRRIRDLGVTMRTSEGECTTDDSGWVRDSYRVRLALRGRTMVLPFHKGTGHNGSPPTLHEVMSALISEHTDDTFEEWADNYGEDRDSRRAERAWRACVAQSAKFAKLIGDAQILDALLYDTDVDA